MHENGCFISVSLVFSHIVINAHFANMLISGFLKLSSMLTVLSIVMYNITFFLLFVNYSLPLL